MKDEGRKWFEGLRQFVAQCRIQHPVVMREILTKEKEFQCRIIGGSLIAWLQRHGPRLLQERSALADLEVWEKDPFIVFTSTEPGLVAAREILEKGPATISFLYPEEFTEWLAVNPDPDYRWHVHTWSYFTSVDAATGEKTKKYPIGDGESYWLHREGTMCGKLFGRGGDHLWKWNGLKPVLLEEGINQWIS